MHEQQVNRVVDDRIHTLLMGWIVGGLLTTYGLWHLIGFAAAGVGFVIFGIGMWKTGKAVRRIPRAAWWSAWIFGCLIGIIWAATMAPTASNGPTVEQPSAQRSAPTESQIDREWQAVQSAAHNK